MKNKPIKGSYIFCFSNKDGFVINITLDDRRAAHIIKRGYGTLKTKRLGGYRT